MSLDQERYPDKFWHCYVARKGARGKAQVAIVNDLDFDTLERVVVSPWHQNAQFVVSGLIVRDQRDLETIQISYTPRPMQFYADQHNELMRSRNINDMATDRRWLPLKEGRDFTTELLFSQSAATTTSGGATPRGEFGNAVFIVHGHDKALKESVARFLERQKLRPIILHEQPAQGRTIIEKFEDYSDVGFAVVLLTPDDVMYVKTEDGERQIIRARQNVVLELGFFVGKLGRKRVAVIFIQNSNFEMPSDYRGVEYLEAEGTGSWQYRLCVELRAAGYSVDANLI